MGHEIYQNIHKLTIVIVSVTVIVIATVNYHNSLFKVN